MKKSRLNALLAAGFVAFLAPTTANAQDYGLINSDTTLSEDSTFTGVDFSTNDSINITTGEHALAQPTDATSGGTITLSGDKTLTFTDAVANISLNKDDNLGTTTVTGTGNVINQTGSTSSNTTSLGNVNVQSNGGLTLKNAGGNTLNSSSVTLGNAGGEGTTTGNSTLIIDGNNVVTITNGVNVTGTGNTVSNTNTNAETSIGNVSLNTDAGVTLAGVTAQTTLGGGENTLALNNSTVSNDLTVTTDNTLNLSTAGTEVSTLQNIVVNGGTANINTGTAALNTSQIQISGGTVNIQNGSNLSLTNGVNVTGTAASRINAASDVNLGTVSIGDDATAVITNATQGTNVSSFSLANNSTLRSASDGNSLGDITVHTGNTDTLSSTAGTATFGTVTVGSTNGSEDTGASTLNLYTATPVVENPTESVISIDSITTVGTGNSIQILDTTTEGVTAGTVNVDTINLSGASTNINNNTSNAVNITTVDYGTDATGLTTTGSLQISTLDAGTTSSQTTMNNSGNVQIGTLEVAKGVEFILNSTGNSTQIGSIQKDGTEGGMNLNLNANGGSIVYTNASALQLNDSDQITLQGSNSINFTNGLSVNGTNTQVSNSNAASQLNNIDVSGSKSLTITANAQTTAGTITLEDGSTTTPTQLSLNAYSGQIEATSVDMKGNSTLNLSGSRTISLTNTIGDGIYVSGEGNTISNSGTGTRNLGNIVMGNDPTSTTTEVTVNGLSSGTNFGQFDFQGANPTITNEITTINSNLGTLNLATPEGAAAGANQALTVNTATGNTSSTFTTADLGTGTSLTLNNAVGTLSGTSVTMNGNNTLSANKTTLSSGVNINGTGNTITADNSSNLRTINMGSTASTAPVGVAISGLSSGTNFAGFALNANENTIKATDSNIGAVSIDSGKSLNLTSTSGENTFTTATLASGSTSAPTTLTLGVDDGKLTGTSIALNGNSSVAITENPTLTDGIYVAGNNNNISIGSATSGANLGTLYLGTTATEPIENAGVSLNNFKADTNFNGISFLNARTNTISANSSELGVINTTDNTQTINITGSSGSNTFDVANINSDKILNLSNTTGGSLSGNSVTLNDATLTTSASSTDGVHLNNVYVNGTNNTITPSNMNVNLGNIILGSEGAAEAGVTVSNLKYGTSNTGSTNNFTGFTFNANNNTVTANGSSNIGTLNVNAGQKLTVTAGENSTTTFTNASLAQGTTAASTELTLDGQTNSNANIGGTSLELNGYGTVNLKNASLSGAVTIKGDNNSVIGTSSSNDKVASFNFAENNAQLAVSNIAATGETTISTTGNKISSSGTTNLNSITVSNGKEFTIENTSGSTSVNIGDGNIESGLKADATLNLDGKINISNLVMNGASADDKTSTVNISSNSSGITNVSALGVNSTGNVINNSSTSSVSLSEVEFLTDESSVSLNGKFNVPTLKMSSSGTNTITATDDVNITNIQQSGSNTLKTNGNLEFNNLVLDGSKFTLNTATGTTTFNNIVTDEGINTNLELNADSGSTITKTTLTTLVANDTLTLSGTGNINLNGVKTDANSTFNVQNSNVNLGSTTIAADSAFNTSGNGIHNTNVENLVIESPVGTQKSAVWNLDFNQETQSADTITIANSTGNSGTMDFVLNDSGLQSSTPFVKYVTLIQTADSENPLTTSMLNTIITKSVDPEDPTMVNTDYWKVTRNYTYYSYIDPNDNTIPAADKGDYLVNRVRITNYDIASDKLLDLLTQEGERSYEPGGKPDQSIYAITGINTSKYSLPNIQAREGTTNSVTLSGLGKVTGKASGSDSRSQLFLVDTTSDSIARTLNINGMEVEKGLSVNEADRFNNSGNGAAIQVISNNADAPATVNLNYFTGSYTEGEETITATANPRFTSNEAQGNGGAIYANGIASSVNAPATEGSHVSVTFTENKAGNNGGAIYNNNQAAINFKTDNIFTQNSANGSGGAIYNNDATMILGDNTNTVETTNIFTQNTAAIAGGAVYNTGASTINNTGLTTFDANSATTETPDATTTEISISGQGGAVYNSAGATLNLNSSNNFTGNTSAEGGAIYNTADTSKISIGTNATDTTSASNAQFTSNIAYGNGGAINNNENASLTINGDSTFNRNIAKDAALLSDDTKTYVATTGDGGAIYNNNATIVVGSENSNIVFDYNEAFGNGGAVASVHNDATYNGNQTFKNNVATVNGGAYSATDSTVNFVGSQTFTDNAAQGKGGAIYGNNAIINITANNPEKNTTFSGNKQNVVYSTTVTDPSTQMIDTDCGHVITYTTAEDGTIVHGSHVIDSYDSNAIYLENASTLNLTTQNDAKIIFNDKIASDESAGQNKIVQNGYVKYNTDMSNYAGSFSLESGTADFTHADAVPFQNGDYKLVGGTLTAMKNGKIIPVHANSLDLSETSENNPANMTIDLNLTTEKSDGFVLPEGTTADGNILITDMNIEGTTSKKQVFYNIAEGADVQSTQKEFDGEIYNYNIAGGRSGLTFNRGDIHGALVAPQVAVNARLAGQLTMFNNMLQRVDEIAEARYFNQKNKTNLYAADPDVLDDRKIDNGYTPYVNQEDGGNAWMKPSFTVEKINPKGYHKYHNQAYNTILGYESPVATLRNGWDLINTAFVGYQGSTQHYDEFRNYQNGGTAGYMANLYHNNFFTGGVVMLGGSAVETHDRAGGNRDMNYGLFDIGAAGRVGYNVGLGKHWLFQPMFTMSYIYISGVDRHNKRGQNIDLKGTNTLEIAPGFKLIGNYSGWQPYLLFDYTWPCIAKTVANVNNIGIPDLKLRSYVEYGVGLQKNLGERFTGYAEAVMRNGGRNGVSLQGGLTFKF